jgi:hypothetical protein
MFGKRKKPMMFGTGCIPDTPDKRDFLYSDICTMTGETPAIDWTQGFDAFDAVGLAPIMQNQDGSSSCVAQATKSYVRRWIAKLQLLDKEWSARFIYSSINLPGGGAQIRDGVIFAATKGSIGESVVPSYELGKPPSETFMKSYIPTQEILDQAIKMDFFTARMIPGDTGNINIFAAAIRDNFGCVGGFRGTNEGWCQPVVRPPKEGENQWGHSVDLCAFGELDVQIGEFLPGTKCLFTKNSWGDHYAIKEGKWAGYQAIPEVYFTAAQPTAFGLVKGIFVFNAWVLVPDTMIPDPIKIADFLKKNEGKLLFNAQGAGEFALVKDGKLLVAPKDRVAELVAMYLVTQNNGGVPKDIWDACPKKPF